MRYLTAFMLIVAGAIHLLPLAGLPSAERVGSLYGVTVAEPNLEILLRHRAVLFGIVGALLVLAAFRRALQPLALVVGLVSVVSFLLLAAQVGGYNARVGRVVTADWLALGCLVVAALGRRLAGGVRVESDPAP
jgi:hypothetical protein